MTVSPKVTVASLVDSLQYCIFHLYIYVMCVYIYIHVCTPIGHGIVTACLVLCWFSLCCWRSSGPVGHGHKMVAVSSVGPVGCRVSPVWIGLVLRHHTDAQKDLTLGSVEPG